jgi:hypothetical protein
LERIVGSKHEDRNRHLKRMHESKVQAIIGFIRFSLATAVWK